VRKRLPSSIASIPKVTATPYKVKRGERGFTVWKFCGWAKGGWRRVQVGFPTEDAGHQFIEVRHGLAGEEPKPESLPVVIAGWYDWTGI